MCPTSGKLSRLTRPLLSAAAILFSAFQASEAIAEGYGFAAGLDSDRERRLERLDSGGRGNISLKRDTLLLTAALPFDLSDADSADARELVTSARRVRASYGYATLALNPDLQKYRMSRRRLDSWLHAKRGTGGERLRAGTDYVLPSGVLTGLAVNYSSSQDAGDGWSAGPYKTRRLARGLVFDGQLAAGRALSGSSYELHAGLSGSQRLGGWTLAPDLSLSLGRFYPSDRTSGSGTMELRLSPSFSRSLHGPGGLTLEPRFGLGLASERHLGGSGSWQRQAEAALGITRPGGTRMTFAAAYSAEPDESGSEIRLDFTIPLR